MNGALPADGNWFGVGLAWFSSSALASDVDPLAVPPFGFVAV
ncbi:hypothetical protein Agau_P200185 (plasmid) [Agrobacterium tumefaciens F2]|nr:hypothetical protein Agau_P200185 [Agrobacterium tumefaciens F2]